MPSYAHPSSEDDPWAVDDRAEPFVAESQRFSGSDDERAHAKEPEVSPPSNETWYTKDSGNRAGPSSQPRMPTSNSTFRGGFALPNDDDEDDQPQSSHQQTAAPSRPIDAQSSKRQSFAPLVQQSNTSAPLPYGQEDLFVELRSEVQGIIFRYNSYNIIRRRRPSPDEVTSSSHDSANHLAASRLGSSITAKRRGLAAAAAGSSSPPRSAATSEVEQAGPVVIRRYSDFVWLHEILLKRYPFRTLPPLPPKRLALPIAGGHISTAAGSSEGFIERRRRGLQRWLRSVV